MVEKYEVTIRDMKSNSRWTLLFQAIGFYDAESQASVTLKAYNDEEIIAIVKDYK